MKDPKHHCAWCGEWVNINAPYHLRNWRHSVHMPFGIPLHKSCTSEAMNAMHAVIKGRRFDLGISRSAE